MELPDFPAQHCEVNMSGQDWLLIGLGSWGLALVLIVRWVQTTGDKRAREDAENE